MANSLRLELFCRLFLGLFVGFFCVTAALFVRYKWASPLPQATFAHAKGASASRTLPGSAPAATFSSVSQSQPATPSPDAGEKTLLASSASTVVTFIAAAVANFMYWKTNGRGGAQRKAERLVRVARVSVRRWRNFRKELASRLCRWIGSLPVFRIREP